MATMILVHGFWADGSSWAGVIPLLDAAGHEVIAVQLPLSSFADDVAAVDRALNRVDGPVVLVGHSYGGVVITAAGSHPKVRALVYVAAYAPDREENVNAINERFPPSSMGRAIRPADGYLWLDPELFAETFAHDVEPVTARIMALTQGPASVACLVELAAEPAWKTRPAWWVLPTQDATIAPDAQRWMAERAGATVHEVPSSHAVLVARPADTSSAVLAAAAAVAAGSPAISAPSAPPEGIQR